MPRYFFDVHDGVSTTDDEGIVLADLTAAKDMAARTLSEMALDRLPGNGLRKELFVSVRDESNRKILRVTLSFAAEVII
jgi:hypothetical protein